jgi:hypothetical protein
MDCSWAAIPRAETCTFIFGFSMFGAGEIFYVIFGGL